MENGLIAADDDSCLSVAALCCSRALRVPRMCEFSIGDDTGCCDGEECSARWTMGTGRDEERAVLRGWI